MTIRVAVVTVSDGVAKGEREDRGGPACEEALRASGIAHEIVAREVLPDDRHQVARMVRVVADGLQADLIVFTGGTGVAPRDRTPEGGPEGIEFESPGPAQKKGPATRRAFPPALLLRRVPRR